MRPDAQPMRPAPRLFGISATDADVVAVIRRGPSNWTHLSRWHLDTGEVEAGSWLRARVYQQRCDVSPDGRYLCYFALNGGATWKPGLTYVAVSRVPWFTALVAWGTLGTYDWGAHFTAERRQWTFGPPDFGDDGPLRRRYGLAATTPQDFAVERRRGWVDVPSACDSAGARREERLGVGRPRPAQAKRRDHDRWLVATGGAAAYRSADERYYRPPAYQLRDGPDGVRLADLADVQWADWSRDGHLLVATVAGELQLRDGATGQVRHRVDVGSLSPTPQPPPREAHRW
jgi:hypothetical protein